MTLSEKNSKKSNTITNQSLKQDEVAKEVEKSAVKDVGEATQKVKNLVWNMKKTPTVFFRKAFKNITGGNSGYLEKSEIDAKKRLENHRIILHVPSHFLQAFSLWFKDRSIPMILLFLQ